MMTETWADIDHPDQGSKKTDPLSRVFKGTVLCLRWLHSPHAWYTSAKNDTWFKNAKPPPSGIGSKKQDAQETRKAESSTMPVGPYVTIGTKPSDIKIAPHTISINILVAESHLTVLRTAISLRRCNPQTPLVTDQWETSLNSLQLHASYF